MPTFNWDEIQANAGGNFKPYADNGKFSVKAKDAKVRTASTGTAFLEIELEEGDDFVFPKISHALSFKNDYWRRWHFMNMLKELGVSEDNAKKAIETAEGKSSKEAIVSSYEQVFKRATSKHPEVKIEVYTEEGSNGKNYARADFQNRAIAFGKDNKKTPSPLADAEDVSDDTSIDLPF